MAHDAYICYSTKDKDIADEICYALENNNITCWIASRDMKNDADEIEMAIEDAKIFVLVFSQNLQNSSHSAKEVQIAFVNSKQIVSINIDSLYGTFTFPEPPFVFYLKNATWIHFENLERTVQEISEILFIPISEVNLDFSVPKESDDAYIHDDEPLIYVCQDSDELIDFEIERLKLDGYEITTDIDNASAVMAYITKNSVNSSKIKHDIETAIKNDNTIIPIYLEDATFKFGRLFKLKNKGKIKKASENVIRKHLLDDDAYHEKYVCLLQRHGIECNPDFEAESEMIEFESSNENSFSHLAEMIEDSCNIVLESDIVLGDGEENFVEGIEINGTHIVIDGAGHTIDAKNEACVFKVKESEITLKNINFINATSRSMGSVINGISTDLIVEGCTFRNNIGGAVNLEMSKIEIRNCEFTNNKSNKFGGAIRVNKTDLKIFESKFEDNSSEYGGAINFNEGEIKIEYCFFMGNSSKENGGAIETQDGILNISNCVFKTNSAKYGAVVRNHSKTVITDCEMCANTSKYGGAIFNQKGSIHLDGITFKENTSPNEIIYNNDFVNINDSVFNRNCAKNIISNVNKANLAIFGGKFEGNDCEDYHIHNSGKSLSITKTQFLEDNFAYNESTLTLDSPKISFDDKIILNKGNVLVKNMGSETEDAIANEGTIEYLIREREAYDFTYLYELIYNSNAKDIKLEHDIELASYENDFFEGGIVLDIDDIVIDGNGHSIDGAGKSRIFTVTGKNITIKNMTFENGRTHLNRYENPLNGNGGVIRNNSKSNLSIINCEFKNNLSEGSGGVIDNRGGEMSLCESSLFENASKYSGGAIINEKYGKIKVTYSKFCKNQSNENGGVIENAGEIEIIKSIFERNSSKYGGSIRNIEGFIAIYDSIFNNNRADNGGAISNFIKGELDITDSAFNDNTSEIGGAIEQRGDKLVLTNIRFSNNTAQSDGGAIWKFSDGDIDISDCEFSSNVPDNVYEK